MTAFARRFRALLPSSLAYRFAPRRCSVASEAVCSARSATVCLCTPRYAKLYCDLSAIMRARYGWASTYSPALTGRHHTKRLRALLKPRR